MKFFANTPDTEKFPLVVITKRLYDLVVEKLDGQDMLEMKQKNTCDVVFICSQGNDWTE